MAGGHADFCWMRCIRRILMRFFKKEYEVTINSKTEKAKNWLENLSDNHMLPQIIMATFQAMIFMLKNDDVFELTEDVKGLAVTTNSAPQRGLEVQRLLFYKATKLKF